MAMTPEQIEELRADMAKGTPGDFFVSAVDPRRICDKRGLSVARAHLLGNQGEYGEAHANADRFARVPTLEAEVLRLTEERAALAEELARMRELLADAVEDETEFETEWNKAARAALSHTGMTGATK